MFLKRLAYALTGLVASAALAMGAGLPLMPSTSQFSEPSQIVGTINALVNQLNGATGYTTATPIVGVGAYCTNTAGGTPQVCNGQRGAVLYTGLPSTALNATFTVVVTDSAIAANSICQAQWITAFTAGSGVAVATLVPTAGSLSVISVNAGATTQAVTTGTLGFNCVN